MYKKDSAWRYTKIKRLCCLLTVWSVRGERAVHYLVAVLHIWMKSTTAGLVDISDVDVAICSLPTNASSAQALCDSSLGNVAITLGVLCAAWYWHLLGLPISSSRLVHLLMIIVLLQVSVSLRMWEILLIAIRLETATHMISILWVKAVLNVDALATGVSRVTNFLNAARRVRKWMLIDLRVVATNVVCSLCHINPSIGRAKFFHFIE